MFGLVRGNRTRDLDRLFNDLWRPFDLAAPTTANGRFVPRLDVKETEDAVEVEAELPGIDAKNVDVSVHNHCLRIAGEKKQEKEEKDDNGYRVTERSYGRFERHIALPENVDEEEIAADYKDGVLHITVPKTEVAKPKKIEVNS